MLYYQCSFILFYNVLFFHCGSYFFFSSLWPCKHPWICSLFQIVFLWPQVQSYWLFCLLCLQILVHILNWRLIFNWVWFFSGKLLCLEWLSICFCVCPRGNITRTTLSVHFLVRVSTDGQYTFSLQNLSKHKLVISLFQLFSPQNPGGGKLSQHILDAMTGFFFSSPPFTESSALQLPAFLLSSLSPYSINWRP